MKVLLFIFLGLMGTVGLDAQTTTTTSNPAHKAPPKTTTGTAGKAKAKKGLKAKKLKTNGDSEFEEVICYEDGPCTFNILKGDTLVYDVNTAGNQYTLMVIPNKFDPAAVADYKWLTPADKKSGHVVIGTAGLNSAKKYMFNIPSGELKPTDASTVWLSNLNYKEISKNQSTTLAIDNGQPETFSSPDGDAVVVPVSYKGTPLNLDGFAIQNKPEGQPGRKEMWVLNISNNLLIIKMDNIDWSMQLKEVRELKVKVVAAKK